MVEATTAPQPTAATTEAPKPEPSILNTPEPVVADPATTLFKKTPTVDEMKDTLRQKAVGEPPAPTAPVTTAAPVTEPKPEPTKAPPAQPGSSPTEYTLELPENSALTKEDLDATLKEAKAAGLPVEKAKELLQSKDTFAKSAQTRLVEKQQQDMKTLVSGWKDAVKKDPEIGGEHLAETAIKASRAFKAVFDEGTRNFIEQMGFGDHPGLVRALVKVHDLIGEDKFIKGTTGGVANPPSTTDEKAKKLFSKTVAMQR